jgi:hypothetical protein
MLSETLTGLHVKYRLFLSNFNAALIFSRFSKKSSNIKSHIYPMEAKMFHADGHMTKLMIAFRNFVNAPNKSKNNMAHAIISEIKSIPPSGK